MQAIDVIVIKERGKYMQGELPQSMIHPHSSFFSPHVYPHCHQSLLCPEENPKWGPVSMPEGTVAEEFPPPPSPANHLKQIRGQAGALGGGPGCSHQGLIRAVRGPSVMDRQEEVAGQWFPD